MYRAEGSANTPHRTHISLAVQSSGILSYFFALGGDSGDLNSRQSALSYFFGFGAPIILPLSPTSMYFFPGVTEQPS